MKQSKKLMLLISLVMMSLNVFSQNATDTSSKDSTKIQLTKPVAKLVIKDLIQFDGLGSEMETIQLVLTETNNKLLSQTDLVTNLRLQINNYEGIINQQSTQVALSRELTARLEADLKKQKLKNKLTMGAGIVGVVAAVLLVK